MADSAVDQAVADAAGSGLPALMVVGPVPLVGNDLALYNRIEKRLPVIVVNDVLATTAAAAGKSVVVITASTNQASVGTKFRDVGVPVIVMEPNLLPTMQMTTATVDTDHGTAADQTKITITAAGHPLTAGLTGDVTVYTAPWRVVYGVPGSGAIRAAAVLGVPGQTAIFAYPAGAAMVGKLAPGKRLSFFVHDNPPSANLTENALQLLDAALDWSVAP